jgi:hypothetical protein
MNTNIQHAYIMQLMAANGAWQLPAISATKYYGSLLPTLTDVRWEHAFDAATEQQRENLARGWIWSYAVKSEADSLDSYGQAVNWCIERCARWIQKIEPFVPPGEVGEGRSPYQVACRLLMRRAPSKANAIFRALWFGTDEEKLNMLLAISGNQFAVGAVSGSVASHNRVFEILSLPGATRQHEICAAYIAMKSAILITNTTPAINDHFNQWYQLALSIKQDMPAFPNEKNNLLKGLRFVQSQPPEMALPVLTRIIHEELAAERRINSLGSMLWSPGVKYNAPLKVTLGNVYIALSEWFPEYRPQWGAAASLGLSVLEAGQMILLTMSDSGEHVTLPIDLQIA